MGKALLIGGIAGLAVSVVLIIMVVVYLKRERKRIQEDLEKSYGPTA